VCLLLKKELNFSIWQADTKTAGISNSEIVVVLG